MGSDPPLRWTGSSRRGSDTAFAAAEHRMSLAGFAVSVFTWITISMGTRLSISLGIVLVVVVVVVAVAARRKSPEPMASDDVSVRLDAFWSWWHTAAPRLAAAVDAGQALKGGARSEPQAEILAMGASFLASAGWSQE